MRGFTRDIYNLRVAQSYNPARPPKQISRVTSTLNDDFVPTYGIEEDRDGFTGETKSMRVVPDPEEIALERTLKYGIKVDVQPKRFVKMFEKEVEHKLLDRNGQPVRVTPEMVNSTDPNVQNMIRGKQIGDVITFRKSYKEVFNTLYSMTLRYINTDEPERNASNQRLIQGLARALMTQINQLPDNRNLVNAVNAIIANINQGAAGFRNVLIQLNGLRRALANLEGKVSSLNSIMNDFKNMVNISDRQLLGGIFISNFYILNAAMRYILDPRNIAPANAKPPPDQIQNAYQNGLLVLLRFRSPNNLQIAIPDPAGYPAGNYMPLYKSIYEQLRAGNLDPVGITNSIIPQFPELLPATTMNIINYLRGIFDLRIPQSILRNQRAIVIPPTGDQKEPIDTVDEKINNQIESYLRLGQELDIERVQRLINRTYGRELSIEEINNRIINIQNDNINPNVPNTGGLPPPPDNLDEKKDPEPPRPRGIRINMDQLNNDVRNYFLRNVDPAKASRELSRKYGVLLTPKIIQDQYVSLAENIEARTGRPQALPDLEEKKALPSVNQLRSDIIELKLEGKSDQNIVNIVNGRYGSNINIVAINRLVPGTENERARFRGSIPGPPPYSMESLDQFIRIRNLALQTPAEITQAMNDNYNLMVNVAPIANYINNLPPPAPVELEEKKEEKKILEEKEPEVNEEDVKQFMAQENTFMKSLSDIKIPTGDMENLNEKNKYITFGSPDAVKRQVLRYLNDAILDGNMRIGALANFVDEATGFTLTAAQLTYYLDTGALLPLPDNAIRSPMIPADYTMKMTKKNYIDLYNQRKKDKLLPGKGVPPKIKGYIIASLMIIHGSQSTNTLQSVDVRRINKEYGTSYNTRNISKLWNAAIVLNS